MTNNLKNISDFVSSLLENRVIRDEISRQTREIPRNCIHHWNWVGYSESLGNRCICSECGKTDYIAQGYF